MKRDKRLGYDLKDCRTKWADFTRKNNGTTSFASQPKALVNRTLVRFVFKNKKNEHYGDLVNVGSGCRRQGNAKSYVRRVNWK